MSDTRTREQRLTDLNLSTGPWQDQETSDAALIATMGARGTRDAFLVRWLNANLADRKAISARLDDFTDRHNRDTVAQAVGDNLIATLAAVTWVEGDTDAAYKMAVALPDHRMADLIRRMIESGMSGETWAERTRTVSEATCLDFRQ